MLYRILLAIDEPAVRARMRALLSRRDEVVHTITTRRNLLRRLVREPADLIVIERSLLPQPSVDSLGVLRPSPDSPDVFVVCADVDAETNAKLIAAGATAVVTPNLPAQTLAQLVQVRRRDRARLTNDLLRKRRSLGEPRLADFVSASRAMQEFIELVERTVEGDATLLILGETGVGKERLARAIHAESGRAGGPFVAVNCAALPDQLLESELFGHTEGAFTGASRRRRGWFEVSHGGTLFLDEVGELPTHLQAKLLRAVQDSEFQPLGSERSVRVDVRLMAATSRDLAADVQAGRFRRDLFYRLSVVTLMVPPLRDHREDVAALAQNYVAHFARALGHDVRGVDPAVERAFEAYDWPGNIRELRNVIERAVLLADGPKIGTGDLPESIVGPTSERSDSAASATAVARSPASALGSAATTATWREVRESVLEAAEKRYCMDVLEQAGGRVGDAARLAGIAPRSLFEKMRRHGLRKEDYRA